MQEPHTSTQVRQQRTMLSTFGVGAVDTSAPTNTSDPYVITYDVSDTAGNAAVEGLRVVIVACKSPTTTCTASDGTLFCSTSAGLCIESTTTATTTATYPTIKLIGQAVLGVTEGTSYLACPSVQPTNVICDRCVSYHTCCCGEDVCNVIQHVCWDCFTDQMLSSAVGLCLSHTCSAMQSC